MKVYWSISGEMEIPDEVVAADIGENYTTLDYVDEWLASKGLDADQYQGITTGLTPPDGP